MLKLNISTRCRCMARTKKIAILPFLLCFLPRSGLGIKPGVSNRFLTPGGDVSFSALKGHRKLPIGMNCLAFLDDFHMRNFSLIFKKKHLHFEILAYSHIILFLASYGNVWLFTIAPRKNSWYFIWQENSNHCHTFVKANFLWYGTEFSYFIWYKTLAFPNFILFSYSLVSLLVSFAL